MVEGVGPHADAAGGAWRLPGPNAYQRALQSYAMPHAGVAGAIGPCGRNQIMQAIKDRGGHCDCEVLSNVTL